MVPFARVEAEELCGRGRHELDEAIWRKMLAVDLHLYRQDLGDARCRGRR